MHNVTLYTAHSIVDDFHDHRDVKIHWFKYDTKLDDVDMKKLIINYDDLDDFESSNSEDVVNELFTLSECALLEKYLKNEHGIGLIVKEQTLPILTKINGDIMCPMIEICDSENSINVSNDRRYSLAFSVMGYFNLDNCFPSKELSGKMKSNGITFMKYALEMMGPNADPKDDELKRIIDKIYLEHDLYVNYNSSWIG